VIQVRSASDQDFDRIWEMLQLVIAAGDSFAYDSSFTKEQARAGWMSAPGNHVFVAVVDSAVVGSYRFRANQVGRGSHVANASYMVDPNTRARGVGTALGEHSLAEAKRLGFLAMQFNLVVSTNERAVALWKKIGFKIIGTIPKAFRHEKLGLVDAYVMHRFLA
jgi:ribosomal protein S18 acetylase RimI-like enzyme